MTHVEGLQLKKQIVRFAATDGFERQAMDQFAAQTVTGSFILKSNLRKEKNADLSITWLIGDGC